MVGKQIEVRFLAPAGGGGLVLSVAEAGSAVRELRGHRILNVCIPNRVGVSEPDGRRSFSMEPDLAQLLDVRVAHCDALPAFTFMDYSVSRAGVEATLTWTELDCRARALAVVLRERLEAGSLAAILAPNGLEYIVAFVGCLRAGVIAVPVHGPAQPGHTHRLASVVQDCRPAALLTTTTELGAVADFVGGSASYDPVVIAVDAVDPARAEAWQPVPASADGIAYLQYTSGSTTAPTGVMISHANLIANMRQASAIYGIDASMPAISWLPLFHDMGLAMTIGTAIVLGCRAVFTTPFSFIHHPARWLRLLADRPGAFSAAPDFAYDYCVKRCSPTELEGLDLSGVRFIINGAEPVKARTLEVFNAKFAEFGLAADTVRPSYGLAEATVFVTGAGGLATARIESGPLTRGLAREATRDAPDAYRLVACGPAGSGTVVRIVDLGSRVVAPAGQVGEIWVHGPSVGRGYWGRPERTIEVFGATLVDPPFGTPPGPWLRTGDLGFIHGGQLYITGRMKDIIIVDGANHYPSDIEHTVEETHPVFRRGRVAAFGVQRNEREQVVIVAEIDGARISADESFASIVRRVRRQVTAAHNVRVHEFLTVRSGTVPITSSGKVQRALCRSRYESGELADRIRT